MKTKIPHIILVSISILMVVSLSAQDKFKVGISMGNVTPIGDFGSIKFPSPNSGFAQPGVSLNFDGDYKLHNRISLTGRLNFGMASMNEKAIGDWLESNMFDFLSEDSEKNLASIDYWQWSSPMIGAKYNYPIIINKLYFETGVFTGISIVQTPDQNLTIIDEVNKKQIFSENVEPTTTSVPFMADVGFRYVLNENMQIEVKSSYFQSKAKYDHVEYESYFDSPDINKEYGRTTMEIPIKTINISVGIIYTIK